MVVFRVKVMELPQTGREELYRTLLELNTTEMVHGAFGIEGETVVISTRSSSRTSTSTIPGGRR